MPNPITDFTHSLRQLGETRISDWDFAELMNRELEIGSSLRRLGNIKVNDWDFKTVIPTFHKYAHKNVELPDLVKRAVDFKVMELDFRSPQPAQKPAEPERSTPDPEEMRMLIARLRGFLQFVIASLIDKTDRAQIRVEKIQPSVVRFHVVVAQSDVKALIGRNGATASAIRNLLKAKALTEGTHALLEINSHEEELAKSRQQGEDDQVG